MPYLTSDSNCTEVYRTSRAGWWVIFERIAAIARNIIFSDFARR